MFTHSSIPSLEPAELVQLLTIRLGETLVGALAGVGNTHTIMQWEDGSLEPTPAQLERLRAAYTHWIILEVAEGAALTRAWFVGSNPWLASDTPLTALREDRFSEVAAAVEALVSGSFSG